MKSFHNPCLLLFIFIFLVQFVDSIHRARDARQNTNSILSSIVEDVSLLHHNRTPRRNQQEHSHTLSSPSSTNTDPLLLLIGERDEMSRLSFFNANISYHHRYTQPMHIYDAANTNDVDWSFDSSSSSSSTTTTTSNTNSTLVRHIASPAMETIDNDTTSTDGPNKYASFFITNYNDGHLFIESMERTAAIFSVDSNQTLLSHHISSSLPPESPSSPAPILDTTRNISIERNNQTIVLNTTKEPKPIPPHSINASSLASPRLTSSSSSLPLASLGKLSVAHMDVKGYLSVQTTLPIAAYIPQWQWIYHEDFEQYSLTTTTSTDNGEHDKKNTKQLEVKTKATDNEENEGKKHNDDIADMKLPSSLSSSAQAKSTSSFLEIVSPSVSSSSPSGWSRHIIQQCDNGKFLGGYCAFGGKETVYKIIRDLPNHSMLRLKLNFHFLDKWEGEYAYIMVDDDVVWSLNHRYCRRLFKSQCKGINVCGDEAYSDTIGHLVDITIPHGEKGLDGKRRATYDAGNNNNNGNDSNSNTRSIDENNTRSTVNITVGSSLNKRASTCLHSWAIDDISVAVNQHSTRDQFSFLSLSPSHHGPEYDANAQMGSGSGQGSHSGSDTRAKADEKNGAVLDGDASSNSKDAPAPVSGLNDNNRLNNTRSSPLLSIVGAKASNDSTDGGASVHSDDTAASPLSRTMLTLLAKQQERISLLEQENQSLRSEGTNEITDTDSRDNHV